MFVSVLVYKWIMRSKVYVYIIKIVYNMIWLVWDLKVLGKIIYLLNLL